MARVDQGLRARSALPPREGKCDCRCVELQGSLPLIDSCAFYWEESSPRVLPNLSLFNITLTPTLRGEIIVAQKNNEGMCHIKRRMQEANLSVTCFRKDAEGTLWFMDRLVVPEKEALKKKILGEAHTFRYSIHPGSTKIYHDLRQQFWWTRMKHKTTHYVSECDTCQKVKIDYMKPGGLLQPLSILDWK
jgi:hypothetical protein